MTQAEERAQQLKGLNRSVHTQQIEDVYEVPMEDIIRPLQSELDEEKVLRMMELVKDEERRKELTPVDLLWVERPEGNYYFSFGGCHRYAAHKRLNTPTIRAKLFKTGSETIRDYMGSSTPF